MAGDAGGAQQRLLLPHLAPLAVVALVGGDRARDGAGAALGAQPQVHLERRVARRLGQALAHLVHDARRPRGGVGLRGLPHGLGNHHDVGVGAVAKLRAAEAAHANKRDARRLLGQLLVLQVGVDFRFQRRLQHRLPHDG